MVLEGEFKGEKISHKLYFRDDHLICLPFRANLLDQSDSPGERCGPQVTAKSIILSLRVDAKRSAFI